MKKIKLFLFLSIFIITLSSTVLAEENVERYQGSYHTGFDKYDSYSFSSQNKRLLSNPVEDEVYDTIYQAFMNLSSSVDLSKYSLSSDEVFSIRGKVLYDHPEIFYLDYGKSSYWSNGKLDFRYIGTNENITKMRNELNTKVENIISEIIDPNMSEFEKELAIHDYIVLNTRYDEENYNNNTIPTESYSTYGILIKGVGVCQGYAESFKLLLSKVGIESIIVSSPSMNHAWNIVNIDGENYQVDVTWNDPTPDRKNKISYKHLNLTDDQMKKNHNWDYNNYPISNNSKYSKLWDVDSPISDGDYRYYTSLEDDFIYRLDKDLNKQKITSVRAVYFDIAGEDIYFSNYSNGGYLFKTKKDGTGIPVKLNDTHSIDIYREGSYIYYTEKNSGIKKSIKVDIVEYDTKVESISLDKTSVNLIEGQIEKLTVKLSPSNATNKKVSWSSSNSSVVTVDNSGNIKALSSGNANIIVTTEDGLKTTKCTVTVNKESFNTPLDKVWTVTFNKEVDRDSISEATIYILDENQQKIDLTYQVNGNQVKLTPKINYSPNKEYKIFITKGVKSNNKNLASPFEQKFDTYKSN